MSFMICEVDMVVGKNPSIAKKKAKQSEPLREFFRDEGGVLE